MTGETAESVTFLLIGVAALATAAVIQFGIAAGLVVFGVFCIAVSVAKEMRTGDGE